MTNNEIILSEENEPLENVAAWGSFYRANPHRFVQDYLGIKLKTFQEIILNAMFSYANTVFLAARGIGKTFLMAIFCCVYCLLYPGTAICVASKTRSQATEIINKISKELMRNSPNLCLEIASVTINNMTAEIKFKNGSYITIVTASENSRGHRAQILIIDEFRMVDKATIDAVLKKFLNVSRHAPFMDLDEYKDYPLERTKEVYASSCWYESHWSYDQVRTYVENMINGRSYFCCSIPYQLAIKENMLDRLRVEDEMSESTFSPSSFKMEMEALFLGESDGGLYSYDDIEKTRTIKYPFYPRSLPHKLNDKRLFIPPKQPGEKRILSADIALMASKRKNKNDATSIIINQMVLTPGNRYVNNIVYMENHEGLRTDKQATIIRRLFEDYDCDYLVIDCKNVGLSVTDFLMSNIYDADTGKTYEALSCINNEDIAARCVIPKAPKKIWAVQGSADFNSQCALGLRDAIKQGRVRLLISENDATEALAEIKGSEKVLGNAEDEAQIKMPYLNTSALITELVELECEVKNGIVKVKEKTNMRKDRYSSLSYNIYVATQLERELAKKTQKKLENSMAFKFRKPAIKKNYYN